MYETNFKFEELVRTDTGLPNYPSCYTHLANLADLWYTLDLIRKELGRPIIVNSAFRSPEVNTQVGGCKSSYHLFGRAADIRCESLYMDELWRILSSCKKNGFLIELIKYSTFYHIAIRL